MEIIGRDKVTQTGDQSSIKINNRQSEKQHKWYETWWGQIAIGLTILLIGSALLYFFGFN